MSDTNVEIEGLRIKSEGLEHIISSQLQRIAALEAAGDALESAAWHMPDCAWEPTEPCFCGAALIVAARNALPALLDEVERLRARSAELETKLEAQTIRADGLEHIIASQLKRIAELERLGDAMADELQSIAGEGDECGLCHVYSSRHNCSVPDVEAWRAFRAASTEAK